MFKLILKLLGIGISVISAIYLIIDIITSIGNSSLSFRSLGKAWAEVSFDSQIAVQVLFSNILEQPKIWDFIAANILSNVPAFVFLFLLGTLLYWLGRVKKPRLSHKQPQ